MANESDDPPAYTEESEPREIKHIRFVAGSCADPKPDSNPLRTRFARCLECRTIIVHYSRSVAKWVDDSGRYHSGHILDFPREWLRR